MTSSGRASFSAQFTDYKVVMLVAYRITMIHLSDFTEILTDFLPKLISW